MMNREENKTDFFQEDESWKDKIEEKAQEVTRDIEKRFHLTETEKNLEALRKEKARKDGFASTSTTNPGFEHLDNKDKESGDDWKEEIDAATFIVLSIEIILLTYFILAVLGYLPFF